MLYSKSEGRNKLLATCVILKNYTRDSLMTLKCTTTAARLKSRVLNCSNANSRKWYMYMYNNMPDKVIYKNGFQISVWLYHVCSICCMILAS